MFDAIIDPTVGPVAGSERGPAALATRPASLSGLRLGLLANTKRNAEEFLTQVGRELAEQHGVRIVLAAKKPNIVETAPEPMMAELRAECEHRRHRGRRLRLLQRVRGRRRAAARAGRDPRGRHLQ